MAAVVAGESHSCALKADGNVLCWGQNNIGQLGRGGSVNTPPNDATPLELVLGLNSGTVKIAAGADHTCVVMGNGAVRCWGGGTQGELGNGLAQNSTAGVEVSGIGTNDATRAIAVTAGSRHSCALLKNQTVRCWGRNLEGQLGINSIQSPKLTPLEVTALNNKNVKAIAAGGLIPFLIC